MRIITKAFGAAIPFTSLLVAPMISRAGPAAAPIPEPDIMVLLASGAVAAVLVARYRKK
jgi:hypothetical protein